MWPFTGKEVRGGDLSGAPGHGPEWAPQATEEDLLAWHKQGSVCMCSDCKRYRSGE